MFIPFEDQREEYVQNDSGLLFMGTAMNLVSRPWSFDQVRKQTSVEKLNFLVFVFSEIKKNHQVIYRRSADSTLWSFLFYIKP